MLRDLSGMDGLTGPVRRACACPVAFIQRPDAFKQFVKNKDLPERERGYRTIQLVVLKSHVCNEI